MPASFRSSFLTHAEITATLRAWAAAHPTHARLESIGESPEGRELWVLRIGRDLDAVKPIAWVDGNMHGVELCGSSVALAIAEDVLALHTQPDDALREGHPARALPPHVRDTLRDVHLCVLPRMSPDGAEAVLADGRYVRSVPRQLEPRAPNARWAASDLDGDGRSLSVRKQDPSGEWVEHPDAPGVMVVRELEDAGPFYKVWPEGTIEHFDGVRVPTPTYLSDSPVDLNRNFPFTWQPEPAQPGAGPFPLSEPESRAVVSWMTAHPSVFLWLNLHTFGGVFIRPLGNAIDKKMNQEDLAVFRQLAAWGETFTGYPTVSGYEEFTYEPDKPLYGDLVDFAYHQRGALAYVCELWDVFAELGMERARPFADVYARLGRDEMKKLAELDARHGSRIFRPWRPLAHPQLGDVEVGGFDPIVGVFNPPFERVAQICDAQSAAYLRAMALAPRLALSTPRVEALGADVYRVVVDVRNDGYLGTYVLASAKELAFDVDVYLACTGAGGAEVDAEHARVRVGHLDGWGRGRHSETPWWPRSRGTVSSRRVSIVARGRGVVTLEASGARTGPCRVEVTLG
ncbi:MAG: M14 family metallopeptidase [Polyangiaceae bacterium]